MARKSPRSNPQENPDQRKDNQEIQNLRKSYPRNRIRRGMLSAAALSFVLGACEDAPNETGNDASADVRVYEVDSTTNETAPDTFNLEGDTLQADSRPDSSGDALSEVDFVDGANQLEVDASELEVVEAPEIIKINQEELEWVVYRYDVSEPHVKITKQALVDCSGDSRCPYEEFIQGPVPNYSVNQDAVILKDPVPKDVTGGMVSTRFVDIADYDICAFGRDFDVTSITGKMDWGPESSIRYEVSAPVAVDSIVKTFGSESDLHRITTAEGDLFSTLKDGECYDVKVSVEMEEEESPSFGAAQHIIHDLNVVPADGSDDVVRIVDDLGDALTVKHSTIIGDLDFRLIAGTNFFNPVPQNLSLVGVPDACAPIEVVPATGKKDLQLLTIRTNMDTYIENLKFPKIEITGDKPGTYTFEIKVGTILGRANANILTEEISIDFSENPTQEIPLPYLIDLMPNQRLNFTISLAKIEEIDPNDTPNFKTVLKEGSIETTDGQHLNTSFIIHGSEPEYAVDGDYDSRLDYVIQDTSFNSNESDSEKFVRVNREWTQNISDDRDSFALNQERLREGCYNTSLDKMEPCPIANLEFSMREYLTMVDGEVTGEEGPYVLQRYRFSVVSTGFGEPVAARVVFSHWNDQIWEQYFEINNGMADYYLVEEIDPSLPESAVQILLPEGGLKGLNGCSPYTFRLYVDPSTPVASVEEMLTEFVQPGQIEVTHKELKVTAEATPSEEVEVVFEGRLEPGRANDVTSVNLNDVNGFKSPKISFEEPYVLVEACSTSPYQRVSSGDDVELLCVKAVEANGPSVDVETVYGINSEWSQLSNDMYEVVDQPAGTTHYWYPTQETTLASWNAAEREVVFSDGNNYGWDIKIAPESSPIERNKADTTLTMKADDVRQLVYEGGEVPSADQAFIVMQMTRMALCDIAFGCEAGGAGFVEVYTTTMDPDTFEIFVSKISVDNPISGPITFITP